MALEPIPPPSNLMAASAERPQLSGMAGGGGGLPQMIFQIEQQIRTLAAAVPAATAEIGQISQLLKAVMMKALPAGGPTAGSGGPVGAQPAEASVGY